MGFIAMLTLLLLSCQFKSLEYRSYKNLKIEKVGFSASTLSMELEYYNPNNLGLTLNHMDLDVYINDNYLGHTSQTYQINIPRKNTFSIPIKLQLDMKNLLKNTITGLLNSEVTIKTSGSIRVGKGKILKTFPFVYSTKEKLSLF